MPITKRKRSVTPIKNYKSPSTTPSGSTDSPNLKGRKATNIARTGYSPSMSSM